MKKYFPLVISAILVVAAVVLIWHLRGKTGEDAQESEERADYSDQLAEARKEIEALTERSEIIQDEVRVCRKRIEELEAALEKAQEDNENLHSEKVNARLADLQAKATKEDVARRNKITELEKNVQVLNTRIGSLSETVKKKDDEITGLQNGKKAAETALGEEKKISAGLQGQVNAQAEQVKKLQGGVADLTAEREKYRQDMEAEKKKAGELVQKLNSVITEKTALKKKVEELTKKIEGAAPTTE